MILQTHTNVPDELASINRRAWDRARFARDTSGALSQLEADKIILPYAKALQDRGIRWVSAYDPNNPANNRAKREGQFISEYTRRISRGGADSGYAVSKDSTDPTAWRRYRIAGTK